MEAFLHNNSTPWLLEPDNPSVRYLALRDILGKVDKNNYAAVLSDPAIKAIPGLVREEILGDMIHFDMAGRGSMWFFATAVEMGLDRRTPSVEKTAAYLTKTCQTGTGGFSLNWNPKTALSCRTGDMVSALIRAGFSDNPVRKGIDWITNSQRPDGGWLHCPQEDLGDSLNLLFFRKAGKGLRREQNLEVPSCAHATCSCMRALLDWPEKTPVVTTAISRAVGFFLGKTLFLEKKSYRRYGYPVFSHYDILQGLLLVARAGMITDRRTGEAFNAFMACQNQNGTWNLESDRYVMGHGTAWKMGKPNKWVTLNALRLLSYVPDPAICQL